VRGEGLEVGVDIQGSGFTVWGQVTLKCDIQLGVRGKG